MPLPFAPLVGWLIGLALALAARQDLSLSQSPLAGAREGAARVPRPVGLAVAFAALVYTPVVAYFAAFHGDWSYLYLVRWHAIPSALDLILILAASATIPLATAVALSALRGATRRRALLRLAAVPALGALALAILASRRLATSATYTQYHGGFGAEPLTSSTLGRGVLLAALVLAAGLAWTIRASR
jgi:hypothetical protein